MSEIPNGVWIGVALAVAHLMLCQLLLMRVKKESLDAFEKLGEFHIIWNNTPRSTVLFWKWLCSAAPQGLSTGIQLMVWSVRLLTLFFFGWFFVFVGGVLRS